MRSIVLVLLAVALIYTGYRLAEVENQRYALSLGMCRSETSLIDARCLATVETRTGMLWHVYYGLFP